MTNLSNGALVAVALAFAGLALAEPNVDERLAAAEASQAAASALNAQLLAPQNYQNGTEELDQARREIQTGQNPERVGDRLTQTENYFEKAIAAANTARNVFAEALTQRQAAEMAKAPELASALWAKGEKELGNAASTLEKGTYLDEIVRGFDEFGDYLFRIDYTWSRFQKDCEQILSLLQRIEE